MIDIIILFFLSRRIGALAFTKGEDPISWQFKLFAGVISAELAGSMLIYTVFGKNYPLMVLFAYGTGYLAYLYIKKSLDEKSTA